MLSAHVVSTLLTIERLYDVNLLRDKEFIDEINIGMIIVLGAVPLTMRGFYHQQTSILYRSY